LVFIDESGLSQRPHRVRTWSPRGQTPVLEFAFNWKKLSAIAGVTFWNFHFRLFPGAIRSPQVILFLQHLLRQVPGKLWIIWDGIAIHRSRLVLDFLATQPERLRVERLPAYAPELNPVEYLWGYWKQHELPNLCARDLWHLSDHAGKALRRIRRRKTHLITAFWKQAELWP
jgi:transposase